MSNVSILIIGCGHIAGFGKGSFRPNHASEIKRCFGGARVTCLDINRSRALSFATSYGFHPAHDLTDLALGEFDLIICATPARDRLRILERLAEEISDTALVLLEKPIANEVVDTRRLASGQKRFFVNFPRSFQTGITRLGLDYRLQPKKIIVHYYKDILSIGIHAFQLLSDLFAGISLSGVTSMGEDFCAAMQWGDQTFPVYFINSGNADAEIFEMDFFTNRSRLRLSEFAQTVEFSTAVENDAGEKELILKSRHFIENDGFSNLYNELHKVMTGNPISDRLRNIGFERTTTIHNAVISHFSVSKL